MPRCLVCPRNGDPGKCVTLSLLAQCRYYCPAIVSTIVAVYAYVHRGTLSRWRYQFAAASLVLLASNYLNFAALYTCFAVDYLFWGRRQPLSKVDWLWILLPQALAAAALLSIWNPVGRVNAPDPVTPWWSKRMTLFWWGIRDLNACEMINGALVLAAVYRCARVRDTWLLLRTDGIIGLRRVGGNRVTPTGQCL